MTFTSDFGPYDEFVGVCHAVMARITPAVRVVDLAHGVRGVRAGAAALAQSVPYAPSDAVHLAVVDPGVGTDRRGVVVTTGHGALLVGPDNGLLLDAAGVLGGATAAFELPEPIGASTTFHGRDVFAPAAARLAAGADPASFGPVIAPGGLVRLPDPRVEASDGLLSSDVLRSDWFGNVQLAARTEDLRASQLSEAVVVEVGTARHEARLVTTFGDLDPETLGVLVDSAGHVAVVCSGGDAMSRLGGPAHVRIAAR